MFKITPVALTAVLFGIGTNNVVVIAAPPGCYPTFSSSQTYFSGSKVSASRQVTTTTNCSPKGENGCPESGVITTTSTVRENYECREAIRCSQNGYEPVNIHGTSAWDRKEECEGRADPVDIPTPDLWDRSGCPEAYTSGADYEAGDVVSVNQGTYSLVYTCKTGHWCGDSGYEPGSSLYWGQAWSEKGACTGSLSPTASPNFDALEDLGGCPEAFSSGAEYDADDKVSVDGFVYQCKSFPASGWCQQDGYAPNEGSAWTQAWSGPLGYCEGTITPTSSPEFSSLTDVGGCPQEWTQNSGGDDNYEEGDRIAIGELVFECKSFPASGWCGQAGYEPMNDENPQPYAWKDAWTLVGYCDGSMGPTASPSFDPDNFIGACPDEWISKTGEDSYEEGDMVAITISSTPERKVAYRCKAWPMNGFCGQLAPDVFGGDQGWYLAGPCDGSMGPTASPNFESLSEVEGGCPPEYSSSADYEGGDHVSVIVANDVTNVEGSLRQVVYECKDDVHYSKFCINQAANLAPGEVFGYLGWNLKGYCEGTISPTSAPTSYEGKAWYIKCNDSLTSCSPGEKSNPGIEAPGSSDCSCSANADSGSHCKRQVCSYVEVKVYSSSTNYDAGDVVRVGNERYKCKGHPFTGWCSVGDRYEPVVGDIWSDAWTKDGTADPIDIYPGSFGNGYSNPLGAPCEEFGQCTLGNLGASPKINPLTCVDGRCACEDTFPGGCGNVAMWTCQNNVCVEIGDGSTGAACSYLGENISIISGPNDQCTSGTCTPGVPGVNTCT